ncbi:MAG: PAS domain S-box protein [Sedimentisphaerales bacterium]|nr:PAS domain S-box protein [Sedimentisphaerales bacterium]
MSDISKPVDSHFPPLSDDYYRQLFDNSNFGIIGADKQGRIISWNRTAAQLFHATSEEMIGRHVERIVPEDRRELLRRVLERAVNRNQSAEFEAEHRDEHGEKMHLAVFIAPIVDEHGRVQELAAWVRDITRRKSLERQLMQAEKMVSLGTLSSGVAHHFNNILGGVMTVVDFALQTDNPETRRRALEMTAEAAQRMAKITRSLLTFAEQDNRQFDLSDLTEVVLTFVHLVEKPLGQKNITVEMHLHNVPVFEVPGSRMHQVLGNLLDNAEQAMPEGGQVHIHLHQQRGEIILQFTDTGCGIAPRDMSHVFEPFFTTRDTMVGGNQRAAGLGLSVVHGIIHEMGGTVSVDSALGQGTTFTIRFALAAAPPQKDQSTAPESLP